MCLVGRCGQWPMADLADRVAELGKRSVASSAERRAAIELAEAERVAAVAGKREALRASMPVVAELVDQFREVFGEGVRVLAAREGDAVVVNRAACERFGCDWRGYVEA